MSDPPADKSAPTLIAELWDLVRGYVRQELTEPLKGLGRYLAFGVMGSLLLGIGSVLLVLGALRALQTETGDAFDGNWSFVPYVLVAVASLAVAGLTVTRAARKERSYE